MSKTYSNKNFEDECLEYIKHEDEPEEMNNYYSPNAGLEVGLIRFRYFQKRKIRRTAEKLRAKRNYENYGYLKPDYIKPVRVLYNFK